MSIIKLLPEEIYNMIAAGEVVERPASVVKELTENALDAGAKNIIIKIKDAGRQLIRVSDDGVGMDKLDLENAFLPHATSKIKSQKDLFKIKTLGFRGEALPSIASVSDVIIKSSQENSNEGNYLVLKKGKIVEKGKTAPLKGTIIDVENLFYNTPARLKYLKSNYTEIARINEVIFKLALAHLNVSFSLFIDEKLSFYSSGKNNMLELIASLYGMDVAREMKYFSISDNEFEIEGYTSSIGISKSSRNFITTILNKRPLKMLSTQNAIIEAYDTYLFDRRYPVSIVNIKVDPTLVDINVHPSKSEARISKEKELNELIKSAIKNLFSHEEVSPKIYSNVSNLVKDNEKFEQARINIDALPFNNDLSNFSGLSNEKAVAKIQKDFDYIKETSNNYNVRLTPIGQFVGKYILAHDEDTMYIIDQHAAAERINYEKFQVNFNDISNWTYTNLLVPLVISFSVSQSIELLEYLPFLKSLGILISPFGNNSFKIDALPTWMKEANTNEYLEEIIDYVLENGKKIKLEEIRKEVIATISCKASLKANKNLSHLEMSNLINSLFKCENPFTCPHGRPTMIRYTLSELDKMFKRT